MSTSAEQRLPAWAVWSNAVPVLAGVLLAFTWGRDMPPWVVAVIAALLFGAVLAAVHHAEVVAHRVGEPFGSLVLAVAVTVIEVALIITMMSAKGAKGAGLARDTVFAAVMITCNGIAGLCLLLGALKRGLALFNADGTSTVFGAIITLAGLTLVLPTFTTSQPGPEFNDTQLTFAALASIAVYGLFISALTVRHRPDYLPVGRDGGGAGSGSDSDAGFESDTGFENDTGFDEDGYEGERPTARQALISLGLLVLALVAVVGLGKGVSPTIERGVDRAGLPASVVGVVIALMVLLPEAIAAVRAAQRDEVQTSLNLALGSAMASIGLTIPAIAVATVWLSTPLLLGLDASHMVLLAMTVAVGTLTFVRGRATLVQGGAHLVLCAGYLVLAVSP
ncbi:sodium/calcium exchanger membrane region [Catenulispora acidiphila DSM 44928]|uniref:Sodium/calcium exchanger membrane region n=1 Tax=Catenulispora acidiphila (strain DSM 44928 / JCM 14897 / NBRC 102108 / NRRL B-24433 / ID139908) TaxID=479433 RepID=C7Q1R2_CATAD|nr:ionic transporter y4hA [Catenulispora acidiphila]ACU75613.1 sodium/calcium exchanger membrane region [Catenulispora acidiphila DSM 44928]